MSVKLIAMGNVLMGDDGIAVYTALLLEERLRALGIEVVYGETDIGYSIAQINHEDFLILLDAASLEKMPGDITILPFDNLMRRDENLSLHNITFLDLLKLYYPNNDGFIIAIQIDDIGFRYGLGKKLKDKLPMISQEIYENINSILYRFEAQKKGAGVKDG